MFLADFHVHSTFSDGKLTIPEVVDLYGRLGFGAIAVTDHLCESRSLLGRASAYLNCTLTPATFPFYIEILKSEAERAMDQYGMVVIPGVELTKNSISNHRSAHILGIGIREFISADGDIVELAKRIKSRGALAIAAHPVWTRKIEKQTYHIWDRRRELAEILDAWEVASGPYLFEEVAEARYPLIASSDLHVPHHITAWKTTLDCERTEGAILQAVREQRIGFHYYEKTITHENRLSLILPELDGRVRNALAGNLVFPAAI